MTGPKKGDRVKVTFEGVVLSADAMGGAVCVGWRDSDGDDRSGNVPGAGIEVIRPEAKEPKAFGALVEVAGNRYTRACSDDEPWADSEILFYSWAELQAKGQITVLFDPDVHEAAPAGTVQEDSATKAEAHPDIQDSEGDRWAWLWEGAKGAGYYLNGEPTERYYYYYSREALDEKYGPLTEY